MFYWMYDHPEAVHELMQTVTDALIDWVRVQKHTAGQDTCDDAYVLGTKIPSGLGGVWISDDDSTLLGADLYREFVVPYNSQVLQAFGGGAIHYCGCSNQHIDSFLATEGLRAIQNFNLDNLDAADVGTLYGAYRFAEKLGVRFYLHGDVLPDRRLATIPDMDETGKPLFGLRGVNPWGSHPFGFDAWGTDDYKALFTQLAKMRMNFLGIHCYPEGAPFAEPTVWHGLPDDFDAQGRVKISYPSHYYNTLVTGFGQSFLPKKTSDFSFGGGLLFEDEAWAPEVMRGHCPAPEAPEDCNEVFNRMAAEFREAFGFARRLGVKTCIGTEAPLILPKAVQERIKAKGKDPNDPATVREIYEGTFRRIMAGHPLDYYWIWTPEDRRRHG
jgi:hypothetical protein